LNRGKKVSRMLVRPLARRIRFALFAGLAGLACSLILPGLTGRALPITLAR
jgi:hypothetical protein